ncbi:uncharacterized protein LOC124114987 [Haliotis rufescens]|uniref:uncharacterized protein LOC124114987 n=1 Tax=Haliotis rufescens TaxID=6454 RepID=UPI001EAFAE27|nr:uncharacterized protein LOC124114987 [Haliotis rufescens]
MRKIALIVLSVCLVKEASGLKCFMCESGDLKTPNFDCPAEGQVAYPKTPMAPCNGKCYIRTKGGEGNASIHRGCLSTKWLRKYLKDGCDVLGSDIWCFCSQTGCNGRRLGEWFPII